MNAMGDKLKLFCTPELEQATVVLALVCVFAIVGLFVFLGRRTKKGHFGLWAVSYLLYAAYLAASIRFEFAPNRPYETAVLSSLLGFSAMFMLWGCLHLADRSRSNRELALSLILVVGSSYSFASGAKSSFWLMLAICVLLAVARI